MKLACENYKGIEFVRIAELPQTQKAIFWQSFDQNNIIKILKNETLLNDCIPYNEYSEWFAQNFKQETISTTMPDPVLQVA